MRCARLVALILLASCEGPSEPGQQPADGMQVFRSDRDGLCLMGDGEALRAGLVTYGARNSNCSVSGTASRSGDSLVIAPTGDDRCRVEVRIEGDTAVVGERSDRCAYYCGPAADYSGKVLRRSDDGDPVSDFAGDPLC